MSYVPNDCWNRSAFNDPLDNKNANCYGWNATPCNGPLQNYDRYVGNVSQEDRSIFYMTGRTPDGYKVSDKNRDITTIYPWRRDVVATSRFCDGVTNPSYRSRFPDKLGSTPDCSYPDLCTTPYGCSIDPETGKPGLPVRGITQLGVKVYKSPIVGLPPFNNVKCRDCCVDGKNCKNCEGVY